MQVFISSSVDLSVGAVNRRLLHNGFIGFIGLGFNNGCAEFGV